MRLRHRLVVPLVAALLGSMLAAGGAGADAACAPADHPGGDWPSYGHDLSNTRTQPNETVITPGRVAALSPAWAVSVAGAEASGSFQSTPVVAEGCVYLTTASGSILALNADDGSLVWKQSLADIGGFLGGLFAPSVVDGTLYLNVNVLGAPRAMALDAATGAIKWQSDVLDDHPQAFTNASAVVFGDLMFVGLSGAEGGESRPGGYAIVDATDGTVLKRVHSVPDEDYERGYAGGSIWATAAVDTEEKYAYVGSGQPSSPRKEHEHINALLKIDLDRNRPTFGEIVDAYKGNPDTYVPGLQHQAACENAPETPISGGSNTFTPTCFQFDVDFGASPNLFRDERGKLLVGALQKSGIYHAAYARTMQGAWTAILSPLLGPAYLANGSSAAWDGESIYAVGSFPGQMASLSPAGGYRWMSPVLSGFQYNPVATANGVVYTADTRGVLNAYKAGSGLPLLHRPMSADVGADACVNLGGGVAIARNTVYAVCDGGVTGGSWVIAYRVAPDVPEIPLP